eukprot:scaffold29753_cov101-Isochrysis_galbana.AAC.2
MPEGELRPSSAIGNGDVAPAMQLPCLRYAQTNLLHFSPLLCSNPNSPGYQIHVCSTPLWLQTRAGQRLHPGGADQHEHKPQDNVENSAARAWQTAKAPPGARRPRRGRAPSDAQSYLGAARKRGQVAVILDHHVCPCDFLRERHLRRHALRGLLGGEAVACAQPGCLGHLSHPHHDDACAEPVEARLVQQRRVDQHCRLVGAERCAELREKLDEHWPVGRRVERLALGPIGECHLPHLGAVQAAVGAEHRGAKGRHERAVSWQARGDDSPRNLIHVDDAEPERRSHRRNGGLAACDAPGQADDPHCCLALSAAERIGCSSRGAQNRSP